MSLIRSTHPRQLGKQPRMEDPAYLESAQGRSCEAMGPHQGDVVACHIRAGSMAGKGRKPDDWRTVFMCVKCHADQEANPGMKWWFLHIDVPLRYWPAYPIYTGERWFAVMFLPWRKRVYEEWRG